MDYVCAVHRRARRPCRIVCPSHILTVYTYITGDIMHIKIFGLDIVIISSIDTANNLMSQASYSDRPILTMVGKLCVTSPSFDAAA